MKRVEQEAVRRHESLARRGRRPRLDVARRDRCRNVCAYKETRFVEITRGNTTLRRSLML